ncbi:hypothetical protein OG339_20040 [Streptosporangium sp. NBC_01495]|uniref:hypothetical protein n=1 Tax=Streptosporangium sp. NBC_01495 TaxID=2903899 RepID=UPI002E2FB1A7|nr:hypothetical protein [Streptosporangium sp. NBC_01495]
MVESGKKRRKKAKKPQKATSSTTSAQAARDEVAESGSGGRSRRELIKNAGLAVGGAAAGWGLAYVFAPQQEVRAQQAVQEAQEKEARAKGPIAAAAVYRWVPDDAFGWAFPGQLSAESIRRLQSDDDAYAPGKWAQNATGVRFAMSSDPETFGFSRIRMTLRGQWVRPVQVTEIRAKVKRFAPLEGTLIRAGAQGGGPIIDIGFDLDANDVVARLRTDELTLGKPYTDDNQLTVEPGEIVTLDIVAQTRRHYCEWDIHLDVEVDGVREPQPLVVRDGDRSFQTTAPAASYSARYFYDLDPLSGGWKPTGPGGME